MAYTMKTDGLAEISEMLGKLETEAEAAASAALYEGAGIMANEITRSAEGIRTEPFRYTVFGTRSPSPEEKEAVTGAGAVGIAKFDKNGTEVNTSVGYGHSGYADTFGRQKAVAQIANAINSGTSFMQKQPFIRKAQSKGEPQAAERMKETIEERLNRITR